MEGVFIFLKTTKMEGVFKQLLCLPSCLYTIEVCQQVAPYMCNRQNYSAFFLQFLLLPCFYEVSMSNQLWISSIYVQVFLWILQAFKSISCLSITEQAIFDFRFLALLAVGGSLAGSLLCFLNVMHRIPYLCQIVTRKALEFMS